MLAARTLAIIGLACGSLQVCEAQTASSSLASHLALTSSARPDGRLDWQLTNTYSSPLVAFEALSLCRGHQGSTYADAALGYYNLHLPGKSRVVAQDGPECTFRLAAAIFADGTRDGEEESLNRIQRRRAYALKQLEPIVLDLDRFYRERGYVDTAEIKKVVQDRDANVQQARPSYGATDELERVGAEKEAYTSLLEHTRWLEGYKVKANYEEAEQAYLDILNSWVNSLKTGTFPKRPVEMP